MARYVTTVRTRRSVDDDFAYMADLRNFAEWDPGVRKVVQVDGNGAGPGAVFDVTLSGRRETMLRYRTVEYAEPSGLLVVRHLTAPFHRSDHRARRRRRHPCHVRRGPQPEGTAATRCPAARVDVRAFGDRAAAGLRRVLVGEAEPY